MAYENPAKDCGVMARIQKPRNRRDGAQVNAYRTALTKRHLRALLYRDHDGNYNHWVFNIRDILDRILDQDSSTSPFYTASQDRMIELAQRKCRELKVPEFTPFQLLVYFQNVTPAQYEVLLQVIVDYGMGLQDLTGQERFILTRDGKDHYLARECGIAFRALEREEGTNMDPLTLLRIKGTGDITELDRALCEEHFAAVEQTLEDKSSGRYRFETDKEGCFVVCAYHPGGLEGVTTSIRSHGFEIISTKTLPLTEEQRAKSQAQRPFGLATWE